MNELKGTTLLEDIFEADSALLLLEKTQGISERIYVSDLTPEEEDQIQVHKDLLRNVFEEIRERYKDRTVDIFIDFIGAGLNGLKMGDSDLKSLQLQSQSGINVFLDFILNEVYNKRFSREEFTRLVGSVERMNTDGDRKLASFKKKLKAVHGVLISGGEIDTQAQDPEVAEFRLNLLEHRNADETVFEVVLSRVWNRLKDRKNPMSQTVIDNLVVRLRQVLGLRLDKKLATNNDMLDMVSDLITELKR